MSRSWWGKFVLLLFFTGLSAVYVLPTVANLDVEKTKFFFKQRINLGLDLQGGLYMVLGVDFDKVFKDVAERQGNSVEGLLKDRGFKVTSIKTVVDPAAKDDPKVLIEVDPTKQNEIKALLKDQFWSLRLVGDKPGNLEFGISTAYRAEIRDKTISQSIEVIRNRIDEFGVTEPAIASQGTDRLVVELPGVKEIERAKDLIGRTAKLEFKIVDDKAMAETNVEALVAEIEKANNLSFKEGQRFSEYTARLNELAKGKIPEGTEIAFERQRNMAGQEIGRTPYILKSKVDVTGGELQDASVGVDQETRMPEVDFSFNPRGAVLFGKLTEENIGKGLAIVLDNTVVSAPRIQSKITERGRITLGQRDPDSLMKEARDLAIVLRAGALPAQLEFLEQRVVGPSLGQDSIKKGAMAGLIGSFAVFLFVAFYYRFSGVIAVMSLVLNVLFVLACLVGFDATLTLPGIAGIALTVGIAVDSNVVIYERIREELRAGKRPHGAIEAGFQKAFRTILDANVTNAAAAIVLLMYGTGPIKGFAVTMLIGIVTTLFTAVFVCRLAFDVYLRWMEKRNVQTISI